MTQVSPSSKKVDDFLSGLSQLSQNKIREDEQRQRELQRSIEELKRLNSTSPAKPDYDELTPVNSLMISDSVPTLKFSRSSGPTEYKSRLDIYEEENPPKLPKRRNIESNEDEDAPKLPRRPESTEPVEENPPPLPTRKFAYSTSDLNINLLQPTGRKGPIPVAKPKQTSNHSFPEFKAKSGSTGGGTIKSFSQIEAEIKNRDVSQTEDSKLKQVPPKPKSKPRISETSVVVDSVAKNDWLSSSIGNKATVHTTQSYAGHVEPLKPTPRPKADWLSSTLHNPKTTVHTSPAKVSVDSPGEHSSGKPGSKPPLPPKIAITSPSKGAAASWLNSAVSKKDLHTHSEVASKPSYIIPKKKNQNVEESEKKTPEYLEKLGKLQKGESLKTPVSKAPLNKYAQEEDTLKNTIANLSSSKKPPPKPLKPPVSKYTQEETDLLKTTLAGLSTSKVPVVRVSKPSVEKYTKNESELLKSTISNLSPNKKPLIPTKPAFNKYEENDSQILRAQMSQLSNKSKLSTKQDNNITEGMYAHSKLKPVAPPLKPKTKPVVEQPPKRATAVEKPKPVSFQDQLSNILRANTVPQLAGASSNGIPTATIISRSNTDPIREKRKDTVGNGKLVHPGKGRAKGPKRKLPKSMQKSQAQSSNSSKKSANVKESDPVSLNPIESSEPKEEETMLAVPKKKPAPTVNKLTKPKPVEGLKPSRNFSGEIFI